MKEKMKHKVNTQDETLHLRQQIGKQVDKGESFYSSCRKQLTEDKNSPEKGQLSKDFSTFFALLVHPKERIEESAHGCSLREYFRSLIERFGSVENLRNRAKILQHRLFCMAEAQPGNYDPCLCLRATDFDEIEYAGLLPDQQRHLFFNLFVARGMSPEAAQLIVKKMNIEQ